MRILFICPSQEPGKCGVGDYTRLLAQACGDLGVDCRIIGLNDSHVGEGDFQQGLSTNELLRLSAKSSWTERKLKVAQCIAEFDPDWVSLQFVPYGYHPRGFCFGLGRFLDDLTGLRKRHVFFHELFLGLQLEENLRNRVQGWIQRWALSQLMRQWKPSVVQTQAQPYVRVLNHLGIAATRLPIFGNIPCSPIEPLNEVFDNNVERRNHGEALLLGGYFGTFYHGAAHDEFVRGLSLLAKTTRKKIVVFLAGQQSEGALGRWLELSERSVDAIKWVNLGPMRSDEISAYLQQLDFGVAATPYALAEKSGSIAAMLDHGLPVLIPRNDWTPRIPPPSQIKHELLIPAWQAHLFGDNSDWLRLRRECKESLPQISASFIQSLVQADAPKYA